MDALARLHAASGLLWAIEKAAAAAASLTALCWGAAAVQGKPYMPQLRAPEFGDYGPSYMPVGFVEVVQEKA